MDVPTPLASALRLEGRRARWLAMRLAGPGSGRPAPLAAARTGLALAVPLVVGTALDRLDLAVLAALGALFTAIVEPGGGYGRHLRVYGTMTVLNALVVMLALACAGRPVAAGIAMLALGLVAGVATAWGSIPTVVAPTCLIIFIVAQAFDPSPQFWLAVLAVAAGSAWVALISVLPWPIAPYAPAEVAVAQAWTAIADYAGRPADDRLQEAATNALEQARDTVASVRSRRAGWSGRSARLWATLVAGARVVSLIGAVEDERRREAAAPGIRDAMDDVLREVQVAARDVALGVIDARHVPGAPGLPDAAERVRALVPDTDGLSGDALRAALVARGRMRSALRLSRRVGDAIDALGLPEPPHVTVARPRRPAHGVSVRAALDPRSPGVRHGLRLGVATGVSVGAFTALAGTPVIGITHGQWVSIALVGVLQPTLGDSVQVAAQRAFGTALGAVVAVALMAIAYGSPWGMVIAIVLIGTVAALLEPVNYMWFVVLFTPLSLLLSAAGAGLDAAIASERLIATGVACAAGLAIAAFAWPTRNGDQLPGVLADALDAAAADLDAVTQVASGDLPRAVMSERHRDAVLAADSAARVTQARMTESIEAFSRPDALAEVEATTMQLVRDIGTLAGRIPLDGVQVPGIDDIRVALPGAMNALATSLRTGSAPPDLRDVADCLARAHDAVDGISSARETPRGLVSTTDMLETIANATQRLAREIAHWETALQAGRPGWWRRLTPAPAARS